VKETKPADETVVVMETTADSAEQGTSVVIAEVEQVGETEAPTWRQIFVDLFGIVNARKGDWTEQILVKLQTQLARFDAEMSAEYGARYQPFSKVVNWIRTLVDTAYAQISKTGSKSNEATPVHIEVLDEEVASATNQPAEA
jgi:glycyl-tRNA synthetase beta subunit